MRKMLGCAIVDECAEPDETARKVCPCNGRTHERADYSRPGAVEVPVRRTLYPGARLMRAGRCTRGRVPRSRTPATYSQLPTAVLGRPNISSRPDWSWVGMAECSLPV